MNWLTCSSSVNQWYFSGLDASSTNKIVRQVDLFDIYYISVTICLITKFYNNIYIFVLQIYI